MILSFPFWFVFGNLQQEAVPVFSFRSFCQQQSIEVCFADVVYTTVKGMYDSLLIWRVMKGDECKEEKFVHRREAMTAVGR